MSWWTRRDTGTATVDQIAAAPTRPMWQQYAAVIDVWLPASSRSDLVIFSFRKGSLLLPPYVSRFTIEADPYPEQATTQRLVWHDTRLQQLIAGIARSRGVTQGDVGAQYITVRSGAVIPTCIDIGDALMSYFSYLGPIYCNMIPPNSSR